ncbi:MAG: pseudouridine-5'-phosphate glycosidase [Myxococcaceae bacterium]
MDVAFSQEVEAARTAGRPLVVLESSVLAQGLPFPDNLAAQHACESAVRAVGAVPAVVAVVEGQVRCGLSAEEVAALAQGHRARKVGARDLAPAVAARAWGGTTVSATCAVAGALGLPVFATGGLGGVHLGGTGDVSEDLQALAHFQGTVVCAGAKSVLDLPRTLEALESLGVLLVGYRTAEFPAFYASTSGLPLGHRVEDSRAAAELLHIHRDRLGRPGALVLCVPAPPDVALAPAEVSAALASAQAAAVQQGVSGQALTPFLLRAVAAQTGGRTLAANVALLANNARVAAEVAVAYAATPGGHKAPRAGRRR